MNMVAARSGRHFLTLRNHFKIWKNPVKWLGNHFLIYGQCFSMTPGRGSRLGNDGSTSRKRLPINKIGTPLLEFLTTKPGYFRDYPVYKQGWQGGAVGQAFQPAGSPDFPVRCAPRNARLESRPHRQTGMSALHPWGAAAKTSAASQVSSGLRTPSPGFCITCV